MDSLSVQVLECIDGTGVCNGSYDMQRVVEVLDQVWDALRAGKNVLISCRNGAHRSATLLVLVLMRGLGWEAEVAGQYVATLRNIVDLESTPPRSQFRMSPVKPITFLATVQVAATPLFLVAGNELVSPLNFRRRALEAGFETVKPDLSVPAGLEPSPPVQGEAASEAESFTMVFEKRRSDAAAATSASEWEKIEPASKKSRAASGEGSLDTDHETERDDGANSMRPSSCAPDIDTTMSSEDSQPALARVENLMAELENLNVKLMAYNKAPPVTETVQLTDAPAGACSEQAPASQDDAETLRLSPNAGASPASPAPEPGPPRLNLPSL